ncbi:benzoate/H(+) symporter BenE family transporter [uncultured Sulfitobacter sp.]|uniref:benzoate/H(+) symporter BenE family transporter n=1 Tax=uncultured Sulfitobacter sp. TaxID=191468 RepID=UPI0026378F59|nr:benzoate/H(+) symporter BenE family transporter [uncultured Sulfitobacter sp.]
MTPTVRHVSTGLVVAIVGFFGTFPIVVQGLSAVGASPAQASAGLMASAMAMGIAAIVLSLYFRMPVSIAWSTPGAALLAVSVAPQGGFPVAVGAFIVAGLLTLAAGLVRPLGHAAAAIPANLAQAMLAGVLFPICLVPFQALPQLPFFVGPIIGAWIAGALVHRLAAVPVALVMTGVMTFAMGDTAALRGMSFVTLPEWTNPSFTLTAAISIGLPLFVVTMATQNVPGVAILRSYGFTPPPSALLSSVGAGSILAAPFGVFSICVAAITSAMCANSDSDPDPAERYKSAVMAGVFYCLFGMCAGLLTAFAAAVPDLVFSTLAGLAVLNVMAGALRAALAEDHGREAAILTIAVTASGMSVAGIGAAVWGLLAGLCFYGLLTLRKRLS